MSPQHSSHENRSDISVLSVISNFFLSSRIVNFYILVSQALALGDKEVKYFFSLNSLTPYVCHTLSSNNIFSTFFFCCQFCVFLAASPMKKISVRVYQAQQNCSTLPCYHCAAGFICLFCHGVTSYCSPSCKNSHQISLAIFCYILPDKFLSRWLAESLTPIR